MASEILTSGYGTAQLILVMGYGSSTSGAPPPTPVNGFFSLDSSEIVDNQTLRARFTRQPLTVVGVSSSRADIATNWTLTGPTGAVPVVSAAPALDDTDVVVLGLGSVLIPGQYTLTVADTVLSSGVPAYTLSDPITVTFRLELITQTPVTDNNKNDNCSDVISSLMHPLFRNKPNFGRLLSAIAEGDCLIREQIKKSFNQLFLASASGDYLTRLAADSGIPRPRSGLLDEQFRALALTQLNSKLTQDAIYAVLAPFFGEGAVRANITSLSGPFILGDSQSLGILVDESVLVSVVFDRPSFAIPRRATALEVAAVINRAFYDKGTYAYALPNGNAVTIYSPTRGTKSAIRIVGGTAQASLGFPSRVFNGVWGPVGWTIGVNGRYTISTDTYYNLSQIEAGDYLVVTGPEFLPANRGSFLVKSVHYAWSGFTLTQWVDVDNPVSANQSLVQASVDSAIFFRPQKFTTRDSSHSVYVTQVGDINHVSLPATAIVNRDAQSAAYLHATQPIAISSITQDSVGNKTITTTSPHGLSPGMMIEVTDTVPVISGFLSSGNLAPVIGASGSSNGESGLTENTQRNLDAAFEGVFHKPLRLDDKSVLFWGGETYISGTPTAKTTATVFEVVDKTTTPNGAKSYRYRWSRGNIPANQSLGAAVANTSSGIVVAGGYANLPWGPRSSIADFAAVTQVSKNPPLREALLSLTQLDNTLGIRSAMGLWFLSQPVTGNTITVTTGAITRTYGFGSGGDVTVAIGINANATLANLAATINADGPAEWVAEYSSSMASFLVPNALIITEKTITGTSSPLRVYGNAGASSRTMVAHYSNGTYVTSNYDDPEVVILPTSDPGSGRAGMRRKRSDLPTPSRHEILSGPVYREWVSPTWVTPSVWLTTGTSTTLAVDTAEATATYFPVANKVLVIGGVSAHNVAHNVVQLGLLSPYLNRSPLIEARCQHEAVRLNDTQVLVMGGRQPASLDRRNGQGFNNWDFSDSVAGSTWSGPVTVARGANQNIAGKIGWGANLAGGPASGTGAGQSAMNSTLLGNYTISGWMTSGTGCVLRNGALFAGSSADNTLLAFGVDPIDDKFYIRYMTGSGFITTLKSTATRTATIGLTPGAPYPRYHHFTITKTNNGPNSFFVLYINGKFLNTWLNTAPSGGTNGTWTFSSSDGSTPRFTGCIDVVGISTTVLQPEEIRQQYLDEVGVVYPNPSDFNNSIIGKTLASCEIVDVGLTAPIMVGSLSVPRYGFGVVKLPDGRILAIGGIGGEPDNTIISGQQRAVDIYEPSTRSWSPIADMQEARAWPVVGYCSATNRVYVSGGINTKTTEYLDLATMRWKRSLAQGSTALGQGTLAGDDIVVAAGGASITASRLSTSSTASHIQASNETIYRGGMNSVYRTLPGTSGSVVVVEAERTGKLVSVGGQITPSRATSDQRPGPYTSTSVNAFWATASELGRLDAERHIDDVVAAGTKTVIDVRYPGDRGLGAAGWGDEGRKQSDIVDVFGGRNAQ